MSPIVAVAQGSFPNAGAAQMRAYRAGLSHAANVLTTVLLGLLVLLATSGCGSSDKRIETKTAVAAFHKAGFRALDVLSNAEAYKQLAALQPLASGQNPLDLDTIVQHGSRFGPLAPLMATRFPSVEMAKRRFASDQPLLQDGLPTELRALLPRSFDVHRLREARVCNLVVSSYNRSDDPALTDRIDRALALLRRDC
jgi:uncharacterized protein YceK